MHRPPLRTKNHKTGRVRFRVGKFGKLITQVEIKQTRHHACPPQYGQEDEVLSEYVFWRDVGKTDISDMIRLGTLISSGESYEHH